MANAIQQPDSAVHHSKFVVSFILRYGLAVIATAAGFAVTLIIRQSTGSPTFFSFYVAIFVSIWFAGRGPGWLAVVLSTLVLHYFFSDSLSLLSVPRAEVPTLIAFVLCAVVADLLSTQRNRAEKTLRSAGERLELTVRQRTAELKSKNEELLNEIAERKRIEASLRASEEWWRTIFQASHTPMSVTDLNGRHIVVNSAGEQLLGYTSEELRQISIKDLTHENDRARTIPLFDQMAQGKRQHYFVEKRYRCKDGNVKWLKASVTRVRNPEGGPDLAASVVEDITERKQAEAALRASEERWRRVFESSAIPMALADGNRRIIAVNPACERLLGYTPEEFSKMSALDFKYGDDREVSARMLQELEQGLRRDFQGELRFRRKDGTPIWVNVSVSYVPATETTPALFPAVIEDITERKQAELERRRLASIVEQANDLMAIADLDGTPIYLNKAGLRMVGFDDMNEAKSRRGTHYLFREDRPFVTQVVWPAVMTKGSWSGEVRFRHFKTGQAIPVLYDAFRLDDPETGRPINVGYVCRDITERKQAEAALRASEARWRTVFETASVGIATSDVDRRILSANAALERMLGYSASELKQFRWPDLTHDDDQALTGDWIVNLERGQHQSYQVEKRYRRKDGKFIWANVNASYVPGTEATPAFFATIIVDIDERRRTDAALRASEGRWRAVFQNASVGMATSDANRRLMSANAALQHMLGYSEAEHRAIGWDELTHPDDRSLTDNWITDLKAGRQQAYQIEKRYRRKDGKYIWCSVNASNVPATEGSPAIFATIIVDIDDRKRAEMALRASEERWRSVFTTSSVGIATADVSRRILSANPAFQRMVGYSEAELRVMGPMDLTHIDDRPVTGQLVDEIVEGRRQNYQVEKRYRRKDGEGLWVSVSASHVPASETTSAFFTAVVVDITDRKRAETALRASEERWRRLFETSSAGMALTDLSARYVATNSAFQAMMGYTDDEFKTLTAIDITYPDERVTTEAVVAEFASGVRQEYHVDKRYMKRDGVPIWVNVTTTYVPPTDITPPMLQGVYINIDDRKRAEQGLRASEERWRTVFETSSVGIATSDENLRVSTANAAFQRIVGYTEDELRKMSWLDLTHEDDRSATEELVGSLLDGQRQAYQIEKRYRRKDGNIIWVNVYNSLVPASETTPAFFPAIVVDITDRKRAEDALRQAQAELARVARVTTVGELGASIAHEINQPLAAIVNSGNACRRWLENGPNLDRAKESLNHILSDANRASDVIKRIRALTKRKAPEHLELAINDVVDEVLTFARNELQAKDISIRKDLRADVPSVMGDRVQLQQVLLNLVMNGIDAMAGIRGRRRVLSLKSERDDHGSLLVTVEDTGAGLDPQHIESIFNAFFTTKAEGMGMGLAISTSIIEAHKGRLWADPLHPHGTAFHFTLPAAGNES